LLSVGLLDASTVNAAPFGCGINLDAEAVPEPLKRVIKRGGMGEL